MASHRKAEVLQGYAVVKTVSRRKGRAGGESRRPSAPEEPVRPRALSGAKAPIGRTILPSRHEVACYHCGAEFEVLGQTKLAVCSRCHQRLDIVDVAIRGEFAQDVTTAGHIHLMPGATLKDGALLGARITIEGRVEGGSLNALRVLTLERGAHVEEERLSFRDLVVGEKVRYRFRRPLHCRDLLVRGRLTAAVTADGLVTVAAGGLLSGSVAGSRLAVEEGGGLKARLAVAPPGATAEAAPEDGAPAAAANA